MLTIHCKLLHFIKVELSCFSCGCFILIIFYDLQVPCILGVNLSDVDLLEFLQQVIQILFSLGYPSIVNVLILFSHLLFGCTFSSGFLYWFPPLNHVSCVSDMHLFVICSLLIQMDHQQCHHLFSGSLISKHAEVYV